MDVFHLDKIDQVEFPRQERDVGLNVKSIQTLKKQISLIAHQKVEATEDQLPTRRR
jgi:hypothetical protein